MVVPCLQSQSPLLASASHTSCPATSLLPSHLTTLSSESMAPLRSWLRATTAVLAASVTLAAPAPHLKRAAITQVSQSQVNSFTPIAHYASASYCTPSSTLTWNCANCGANPSFHPVASGGDGATVQYCECSGFRTRGMKGADTSCAGFVGYDPNLESVVVSVQGTKPSAM